MRKFNQTVTRFIPTLVACVLIACASAQSTKPGKAQSEDGSKLRLGNFSVSLAVKDIAASRAFYEKLGFRVIMGTPGRYLILQNETATIGLFQGMFDKNVLTFNPGWDRNAKPLSDFDDVRDIQKQLEAQEIKIAIKADGSSKGPAGITFYDPDGNQILVDQHVPKPTR